MAEERALGLARAQDYPTEGEPSKEELQRRLGQARDSITNTVTEIKETVAHQVQAVKDTLDWREQFKKRPVVWSAAALGVGFATGYCIANYAKGDDADYDSAIDRVRQQSDYYTSQSLSGAGAAMATPGGPRSEHQYGNGMHDKGPSFFTKMVNTPAFERVKDEAGNIGNALMQEISKTAKTVVLPALMTSLRNFIGDHLPNADQQQPTPGTQQRNQSQPYQPSMERNPS
jgi:hypothetical protein